MHQCATVQMSVFVNYYQGVNCTLVYTQTKEASVRKKKTVQENMQYKYKVLNLTNLHDTGIRHTGVTIEGEGKNRQRVKQDEGTELVELWALEAKR